MSTTGKKGNGSQKSKTNAVSVLKDDEQISGVTVVHKSAPNEQMLNDKTSLAQAIAEVVYYGDNAELVGKFQELPSEDQRKFLYAAHIILNAIEQLNMMVVPKRDLRAERLCDKHQLMDGIKLFLEGIQKPKDLAETFPIEELAVRLIEGRRL